MPHINEEYADLFEKYGYLWADAFNKAQGRGWDLLPIKPRTYEERNRIFVEFVKRGYAVHTEEKYGSHYIYMLKLPENVRRAVGMGIIRNYATPSFDPVKISTLEKTGRCRLEAKDGIKIREILMKYKAGLFDTMDAYQYIKDVVERM